MNNDFTDPSQPFTTKFGCHWCCRTEYVRYAKAPDDPWAKLPPEWERICPAFLEFCSRACLVAYVIKHL